MCLVRAWNRSSLAKAIADWLSERIGIGVVIEPKISDRRFLNQIASFAAWVRAIYSASVVDKEIVSCLFDDHETAPPLSINTYPEIACLSSCDIPSASEYPVISSCFL